MILRLLLPALLVLGLVTGAAARDLTDAERTALTERVDGFNTAMRALDMGTVLDASPPKVFEKMAAQAGTTADALREMVIAQTKEAMETVTIEDFGMDLDAATFHATEGGVPYALIPTKTIIAMPDAKKVETRSQTLAFMDEGTWYLMRVNDPGQMAILAEIYPEFTGIEIPRDSMKIIE